MPEIMGSIPRIQSERKNKKLTRGCLILASLAQMFKEKSVFFPFVIYENKCRKQDIASIV